MKEMGLEEYVDALPPTHRARLEFQKLGAMLGHSQGTLSELRNQLAVIRAILNLDNPYVR